MKFEATVHAFRKSDVLNPEETPTLRALNSLGFKTIEKIQMGRVYCFTVNAPDKEQATAEVNLACRRLIVNLVTDTFQVETIQPVTS